MWVSRSVLMTGTSWICCFIRKTTIRAVAPWLAHGGKKEQVNIDFHEGLKIPHFCIKFILKSLFHSVCLSDLIRKKDSKRDRKAVIGSKAVNLEVKHLHQPQRRTDGCIKPVHFSSNSLLHWRKTGHSYCQRTREIWRWTQERRVAWTERGGGEGWKEGRRGAWVAEWNRETVR